MIKFLIISFCIYLLLSWVLKPILRMVLPLLVKKVVQNQSQKYQSYTRTKPEGTINVDYVPDEPVKKNQKKNDAGEYVDYEEVK